jgi:hypothetical protein
MTRKLQVEQYVSKLKTLSKQKQFEEINGVGTQTKEQEEELQVLTAYASNNPEFIKICVELSNTKCVTCSHIARKHNKRQFHENNGMSLGCKECECKEFIADNLTYIEKQAVKNNLMKEVQ